MAPAIGRRRVQHRCRGGRPFLGLGRGMVGRERARWPRSTGSTRCGSATSGIRSPAISDAKRGRPRPWRACAFSTSAAAPGWCPSRSPAWAPRSPASTRRPRSSPRRGSMPRKAASPSTIAPPPPRRSLPRGETFDAVLILEVVEHVADVAAFVDTVAGLVKTGRPGRRLDHQPHPQGLRAGHRRRRVSAPLAAARHPQLRQARHARRNSPPPSAAPA